TPAPAPGRQTVRLAPLAKFCPSAPACGGRGRGPARREPQARGLDPWGWEGEVGSAAVRNEGLPPPHPDPLRPGGRRGAEISGARLLAKFVHVQARVLGVFPR